MFFFKRKQARPLQLTKFWKELMQVKKKEGLTSYFPLKNDQIINNDLIKKAFNNIFLTKTKQDWNILKPFRKDINKAIDYAVVLRDMLKEPLVKKTFLDKLTDERKSLDLKFLERICRTIWTN